MTGQERPVWLLGPAELAAIGADDELRARLAAGEPVDESDPLGAQVAAWLREVGGGEQR